MKFDIYRNKDKMWVIECEDLHILSYGDTLKKALLSFHEDISDTLIEIGCKPDKKLEHNARKLKRKIREFFGETI